MANQFATFLPETFSTPIVKSAHSLRRCHPSLFSSPPPFFSFWLFISSTPFFLSPSRPLGLFGSAVHHPVFSRSRPFSLVLSPPPTELPPGLSLLHFLRSRLPRLSALSPHPTFSRLPLNHFITLPPPAVSFQSRPLRKRQLPPPVAGKKLKEEKPRKVLRGKTHAPTL